MHTHAVFFSGWSDLLYKVSLTNAIKQHAGLTLKPAKQHCDAILRHVQVVVNCPTDAAADNLVLDARACGAECRRIALP